MEKKLWGWYCCSFVVLGVLVSESQAQNTSCLNQLAPCLNYLNGNRDDPPSSCCDPLKWVIKSNPECLCSMISSRASSQAGQAGINTTKAQELPGRCGENVNPFGCLVQSSPNTKNSMPNAASSFTYADMMLIGTLSTIFHCFMGILH